MKQQAFHTSHYPITGISRESLLIFCLKTVTVQHLHPHPEAITDKQVSLFLALLFRQDNTRQLMEKVFAGNGNFQGEEADRERS